MDAVQNILKFPVPVLRVRVRCKKKKISVSSALKQEIGSSLAQTTLLVPAESGSIIFIPVRVRFNIKSLCW